MSHRITQANLQAVVDRLNRLTGSPLHSYVDGKACIGNYQVQ